MAFFNYATMQMAAKIVYYGPGLCGKTTNLQYIFNKTSPRSRGEMVSLETESDRTLFFDLLPLEVGVIAGFKTRFQLYTVPGQVFYGETRRMVLKGVDGVVFVADSQSPMREANIESLKDLEENLSNMDIDLKSIPLVLQYNKRDLPNLLSVKDLEMDLNWYGVPSVEASAINGSGVFDTLKGISRITLHSLKTKLIKPTESVIAAPAPPPLRRKAASGTLPGPSVPPPVQTPGPPPSAQEDVEFATLKTRASDEELARKAPKVKTVNATGTRVALELDRIRESLLTPLMSTQRPKVKDLTPEIDDLKKSSRAQAKAGEIPVAIAGDFLSEADQDVRIELRLSSRNDLLAAHETVVVNSGDMEKTPDGWILRLRLTPRKA